MAVNLSREEGFTFLEALISLAISSAVILLLTSGIIQAGKMREGIVNDSQQTNNRSEVVSGDRQIEWHLFLNQLETLLIGTKNPQVSSNILVVDEWDKEENRFYQVLYERLLISRSILTRKKDGGNQRMLTGIHTLHFKREGGWLFIASTFQNGEVYKGRIWIESWVENEKG